MSSICWLQYHRAPQREEGWLLQNGAVSPCSFSGLHRCDTADHSLSRYLQKTVASCKACFISLFRTMRQSLSKSVLAICGRGSFFRLRRLGCSLVIREERGGKGRVFCPAGVPFTRTENHRGTACNSRSECCVRVRVQAHVRMMCACHFPDESIEGRERNGESLDLQRTFPQRTQARLEWLVSLALASCVCDWLPHVYSVPRLY